MMIRQVAHAAMMLPRLLRRQHAAAYLDVSTGYFDKLVKDGTVPPPKRLADGVRVWDVRDLDALADSLEYDAQLAPPPDKTWD